MNLLFKPTTEKDLPFYIDCFLDKEFQYMLFGNSPIKRHQLKSFLENNKNDKKYVLWTEIQGEQIAVGFVHFNHIDGNQYLYLGGIHPRYFNSGIGVLVSIASLSLFWDINKDASFTTGIYKHNPRSLKLHMAIGFVITDVTKDKYLLYLDKDGLNKDFTEKIKKRISYELVTAY